MGTAGYMSPDRRALLTRRERQKSFFIYSLFLRFIFRIFACYQARTFCHTTELEAMRNYPKEWRWASRYGSGYRVWVLGNGTENSLKDLCNLFWLLSGRNSPRWTASGTEKAYRPSRLMCS